MDPRDETPRRRRTKRRNETRERDVSRIETVKSFARRRRLHRRDDDKKVEDAAAESSDDDSDDEDKSTSGSTIASSTAPPPATTTLPPSPPPPPIATPPSTTETPPPADPAEASTPAAVPLPTTTSATLESQTLPPASTTLDTQTIISAAPTVETPPLESSTVSTTSESAINTPIAAGETTDPPRDQNGAGVSRQSNGVPPAATTAIAVFGTLAGVGLLAFLFWKLYRRRRGRDEPDQNFGNGSFGSGPKSDIRIMDEAMAAAYKVDGGNSITAPSTRYSGFIPPRDDPLRQETADQDVSRWSDSTPGWFRRQVQKVKPTTNSGAAAAEDPSPKDAAVSRWMDRHESKMLDPMAARASIASSGVASLRGLGPVPSVSPASVVPDQRESILSEMGQIRRAAVPPPLDPKLVQRVRQMQEEEQMREQEQMRGPAFGAVEDGALRPPQPIADRWGGSSPTAMSQARTESTWNTWGVEQRRK